MSWHSCSCPTTCCTAVLKLGGSSRPHQMLFTRLIFKVYILKKELFSLLNYEIPYLENFLYTKLWTYCAISMTCIMSLRVNFPIRTPKPCAVVLFPSPRNRVVSSMWLNRRRALLNMGECWKKINVLGLEGGKAKCNAIPNVPFALHLLFPEPCKQPRW